MSDWYLNPDGTVAMNADGTVPFLTQAEFEACCCAAPCTCPYNPDLSDGPQELQIVGYSDGDLQSCTTCADSILAAWDGSIPRVNACLWRFFWPSPSYSINGKELYGPAVQLNTEECRWELWVLCRTGAGSSYFLWFGIKTTGLSPVGVYSYTVPAGNKCVSLNEAVLTLEIEEAAP